jgi:WD40 repeat protein
MAMKAPEKSSTVSQLQKLFATTQLIHTAKGCIDELKWNPEGTLLAATSFSNNPFILDPKDNSVVPIPIEDGKTVRHLAWNKSGKRLAFANDSQKILIFDVTQKVFTHSIANTKHNTFHASTVAWSPTEENVLACCGHKGFVQKYLIAEDEIGAKPLSPPVLISDPAKWSVGAENFVGFGDGFGYSTRCDWRGEHLAMAYRYGAFFATQENAIGMISHANNNNTECSRAIACHPQKNIIACAFDFRDDHPDRRPRIVLCTPDGKRASTIATQNLTRPFFIPDLSFSHDGTLLAAAYANCVVIFDGNTLENLHTHELGNTTECSTAQWHPTKNQLAFSDAGKLFITQELEAN